MKTLTLLKLLVFQGIFKKFENEAITENIFISPSSIYKTLLLAYIGANGKTQENSLIQFLLSSSTFRIKNPVDILEIGEQRLTNDII